MFSPLTPTNDPRSTMVPAFRYGASPLNRLAGYIGMYFTYWIAEDNLRLMRQRLNLPTWDWGDYARAWNRVPVLAGISPIITPPDPRWGDRVAVTGFWFDTHEPDWQPPDDLQAFLDAGAPPVYVGFGSMPDSKPAWTTQMILSGLERSGQRGIIHRGWAKLGAPDLPDSVMLVDGVPHDWLFPRMAAVVHHGGAGTVAATLKAGVPSTIVPHLGDQPYWGRRLHELGAAAKPIRRLEFHDVFLGRRINAMLTSPTMRQRAAEIGAQLRAETGVQNAVAYVNRILGGA
jgi:UDP:flavonoid glycosyltransferase YjiC (YdhE family)